MTEQEAIKEFEERLAIADFKDDIPEYYEAMELAVKSLEEIQQYRVLESRLSDMFGGNLPLSRYVDELELTLKEPDKPHPINAIILTIEPQNCKMCGKTFWEKKDNLYCPTCRNMRKKQWLRKRFVLGGS